MSQPAATDPRSLPAGPVDPAVPRGRTAGRFLHTVLHRADPARARRGFVYARDGAIRTVTLQPATRDSPNASLEASVRGSGPLPYSVDFVCDPLGGDDWRVLRGFVTMNAAALTGLDPDGFVMTLDRAAGERGIRLFPGPRDFDLFCNCPDDSDPCKHGVALAYSFAQVLDDDPLALLLLRGHDPAALQNQSLPDDWHLPDAPTPVTAAAGVPAEAAFAEPVAPLPALPRPTDHTFTPALLPDATRPDPDALTLLSADAALRARTLLHRLLTEDLADHTPTDPARELAAHTDAVRWAADHPLPTPRMRALRAYTNCTAKEFGLLITAWRNGGPEALDILITPWDPPADEFQPALQHLTRALAGAGYEPSLQIHGNHVTSDQPVLHLRYGHDGLWYPYTADGTPSGPPAGYLDTLVKNAAETPRTTRTPVRSAPRKRGGR